MFFKPAPPRGRIRGRSKDGGSASGRNAPVGEGSVGTVLAGFVHRAVTMQAKSVATR